MVIKLSSKTACWGQPALPSGAARQGRLALPSNRRTGALLTEIVVAMGILAIALVPLSVGFVQEIKVARSCYYQGLAMEIVDGEMEILVAGEWKNFKAGTNAYTVRAESVTNLPPGQFQLTVLEQRLRLEWMPKSHGAGGPVVREVKIR